MTNNIIWGKYVPQTPKHWARIGSFEPKCLNVKVAKTVNPINPKFEDKAETTTCTSLVGYHYNQQIQHG